MSSHSWEQTGTVAGLDNAVMQKKQLKFLQPSSSCVCLQQHFMRLRISECSQFRTLAVDELHGAAPESVTYAFWIGDPLSCRTRDRKLHDHLSCTGMGSR